VWCQLAGEVEALRVYDVSGYSSFRLLVRLVTSALYPNAREPATARARTIQAAQASLAACGLRPADRDRVRSVVEPKGSGPEAFLFKDRLRVVGETE
jgi:hypothetical protein